MQLVEPRSWQQIYGGMSDAARRAGSNSSPIPEKVGAKMGAMSSGALSKSFMTGLQTACVISFFVLYIRVFVYGSYPLV
jgi:hypothetical protein